MFFSQLSKLATEIINDIDYSLNPSAASCLKSMLIYAVKQSQSLEKYVGTPKEKRLSDAELILTSAASVAQNATALSEFCRVTGADIADGFRVMLALNVAVDKFAGRHGLSKAIEKLRSK
jgi:hypothetical protein